MNISPWKIAIGVVIGLALWYCASCAYDYWDCSERYGKEVNLLILEEKCRQFYEPM